MKRNILATAAFVVASFTFSAPAQAAVTNGGFETGDFTGWTQTGNTTFNGVQCPGPGPTVSSGNCSAFFGPVGSVGGISQALTTVAGQQYLISFSILTDGGNPSSVSASFGATNLLSLTNPGATAGYTNYEFNAFATGSSTALSFSFRDDPGFIFLDSVSIAAVPEPSTWAMMLIGFGAVGFAMRRRNRLATADLQPA